MWTEAWPSLTIVNMKRSLRTVVALVEHPQPAWPDEVTSALARFLVIRSCGYLELVVDEACKAYMVSKSTRQVSSFGASWLGHGGNPSPGHLVSLVRRFDSAWAAELQAFFDADDEALKREISFLVDRRNKMAHGASENTGTAKALELTVHAQSVADWFIRRFDPR